MKARVLFGTFGYYLEGEPRAQYASRGEIVDLDKAAISRGVELGALTTDLDAPTEPAASSPPAGATGPDLSGMSLTQLRAHAKDLGLSGTSRATEPELLAKISALPGQAPAPDATRPNVAPGTAPGETPPTTPAGDPIGDGKTDVSTLSDEERAKLPPEQGGPVPAEGESS